MDIVPILLFVAFTSFVLGAFFDAPWVPTRKKDFDRIARLANLRPGMTFYELGSGTGAMLFYLSRRYKIRCVGIEIAPLLYLYSKIKSLFYGNVTIKYENCMRSDLSQADAVYAWFMPKTLAKLREKMEKSSKDGAVIVVPFWPFENANPVKTDKMNDRVTYYLYDKNSF